jgi:heme-degrading monooxygenase HmoA
MIARIWRGRANASKADGYRRHFTRHVAPHLKEIPGHEGAYLLRRETGGEVEFVAITLWRSIDTIKRFAGANPDVAVVEPEARALLSGFDDFVTHYEVVHDGA